MHEERPKSGVITFKSQRELNEERQQKLQKEYKALKEETAKILKMNRELANSLSSNKEHLVTLTEEEIQKIYELNKEINQIYENAKKRAKSD